MSKHTLLIYNGISSVYMWGNVKFKCYFDKENNLKFSKTIWFVFSKKMSDFTRWTFWYDSLLLTLAFFVYGDALLCVFLSFVKKGNYLGPFSSFHLRNYMSLLSFHRLLGAVLVTLGCVILPWSLFSFYCIGNYIFYSTLSHSLLH
jgi:hypothetical protein